MVSMACHTGIPPSAAFAVFAGCAVLCSTLLDAAGPVDVALLRSACSACSAGLAASTYLLYGLAWLDDSLDPVGVVACAKAHRHNIQGSWASRGEEAFASTLKHRK